MVFKRRLEKIEEALNSHEFKVVLLDKVSYYKEDDKYYKEATNGKEWIKYEIDPHQELSDVISGTNEVKGREVERKGINGSEYVLIIERVGENKGEVIYEETFEGKTRALLKDGMRWD